MRNLGVDNSTTLLQLLSNQDKQVKGLSSGLFVDLLSADDNLGQDRWDEVKVRLGQEGQNLSDRRKSVTLRWRGSLLSGSKEKLLQLGVALRKCQASVLGLCKTWDKLVGLLLQLRVVLLVDDSGSHVEETSEALSGKIDRHGDDKIHQCV